MPGISGKKRVISMIDKSQKILINAFPMSLIFSQIYALSLQSFLCQMCAFVESTIAMEESGEVLRIWGDDVMVGRGMGGVLLSYARSQWWTMPMSILTLPVNLNADACATLQ